MKFGPLPSSFLFCAILVAVPLGWRPVCAIAQSAPEQAQPEQTKPEETKPEEKKSDETTPQDRKPTETAPAVPEIKDSKPLESASPSAPAPDSSTQAKPSAAQQATAGKARRCRKSKSGSCLKQTASATGPRKVVVRKGSTSEPTAKLAPMVPNSIASQQAQVTEQLLSTAENNLKEAAVRQLNADQTAVMDQVRNYIQQARAATKAGDFQRGHNLAVKARLLSDDLIAQ